METHCSEQLAQQDFSSAPLHKLQIAFKAENAPFHHFIDNKDRTIRTPSTMYKIELNS